MKKVAIVGVEGSGKTVLMAAMGDKYKSPDANGYFMMPQNQETFAFYTRESDKMRSGAWPQATAPDSFFRLDWSLNRKKSERSVPEHICEITFADFAGETYRTAFGDEIHGQPSPAKEESVSLVKEHVLNSDVLIVLVNLADVINGSHSDARTIEMLWLTQDMLRQANRNGKRQNTALVFTQADAYSETITACGGLTGVLSKYLPQVYAGYSNNISLFAVSAVSKTIPAADGSGYLVPAPDFLSDGFEQLVKWISDSAERITDDSDEEVHKGEKKRGVFYQLGRRSNLLSRFFLCGLIAGSCLLGWAFGWEPIYWEYFYFFSEVEKCRKCAWETLDAVNDRDIEKFKVLVEMPYGIENWTGVDKTVCVQDFAKERGKFWDICKGMTRHDGRWSYHSYYCYPERDEIESCFACSLYGKRTSVFSFSGLSYGKSSYSDNDLLIVLCVRKQGSQHKTVRFDFNKEERLK